MKVGRWVMNVLISLDQLGNSIGGGDPDETISSRIGRIKVKWGGRIPPARVVVRLTDWALDKIQRDHCRRAIEAGRGDGGIFDKP